ncbi:beta-ketoacyl-ACP synthase II [Anaerovoracaceae bacterium 42-11]
MKRRVVITGMGALSPIGNTVEEMWANARAGVCGIDFIKGFDTTEHKVKIAGELKNFEITDYMDKMAARRTARFTQLALIAAREAMAQSGLDMSREDAGRCGVNISSGIGGLPTIEEEHYKGMKRGFDKVSPLFVPMAITNMAAGMTAIEFGFQGSCTCVVTACASATNAIGEAFRQIRDGYADVFLTGGSESCVSELGIGGFTSMKALSESEDPKRASIPFDKERNGFVMGEGAGVLLLEEYEHAVARGAEILCEIAGYGVSCDAHHMTAPLEDGSGAAACMKAAMADAGIEPNQVAYINAHGTSTPMNDKCETRAVKSAFGDAASDLLMSSTKSMTGHLLGASGAVEASLTVCALRDQFAPPTIGYQVPDPECDLDIVANAGKSMTGDYAMSNSLGFGGHNGSILFRRVK